MNKHHIDIRSAIRSAIERRELSLSETARRAEITPANLSEYLAEKTQLRSDSLDRLFAVLNVRLIVKK